MCREPVTLGGGRMIEKGMPTAFGGGGEQSFFLPAAVPVAFGLQMVISFFHVLFEQVQTPKKY